MVRTTAAIFIIAVTCVSALAHEYWLEPENFFLKPGDRSVVHLYVGEALKQDEERVYQSSKTSLFRLFSAGAEFDLTSSVREDDLPLMTFSADRQGNYMLAMERNWSYITLEPEKFEDYLREDGMEYIIAERSKRGESKKEGKERYSRYLKSLLQVGDRRDKTFAKHVGSTLEIVPLENPYSRKAGDTLNIQVLFLGRPLAGKTIFADNRVGKDVKTQSVMTDIKGNATIKLDRSGTWLVRLVFMQRCSKNCEGADWESFWGSFSFGIR